MTNEEIRELEKNRKIIESTYDMYESFKIKTREGMENATNPDGSKKYTESDIELKLKTICEAQDDKVKEYVMIGGNPEDLKKRKVKKKSKGSDIQMLFEELNKDNSDNEMVKTKETKSKKLDSNKKEEIHDITYTNESPEVLPSKTEYDSQESFDVIPIPSKGECYKHKVGKLSVAYLTAYDENMIVSPNLYRDNLILDYLLKEKIINSNIDPYDLTEGDRDAIILFLRASGYGSEYPITATDNETGIEFNAVVDLSKLKFKEFTLKGDENGWFDYTLPVSKHEIKFKYLTHRDLMNLDKINEIENDRLKKSKLNEFVETMDMYIDNEKSIEKNELVKIRQAIRTIEKWGDVMDGDVDIKYTHDITNRLILSIMSIDGNTDRGYISDFVKRMNVKDSSSLRKYINKNEPGIDYNIEIEKPESLGGGSMTVFLQLDQFIFLNIAE